MDNWLHNEERKATERRRQRPNRGASLHVGFDARGELLGPTDAEPPAELRIEATDDTGEIAPWLDDFFWLEAIKRWSCAPLNVHIESTPGGMLHAVVLHQLWMLRRVAPAWRLTGHCYVGDLAADGAPASAALSPYHDIHVIDGPRAGEQPAAHRLKLKDAVASMRKVQQSNGRTTPIIVCCPSSAPEPPTLPQPKLKPEVKPTEREVPAIR